MKVKKREKKVELKKIAMIEEDKVRRIPAIRDGIVIDHIPCGNATKVLDILNIQQDTNNVITVGINLFSAKMGKKDVVKIENKKIETKELQKISIIAPNANISFIKNYAVFDKIQITIPDVIIDIIKCNNYNCITNHQNITTKFFKIADDNNMLFRCNHCEKTVPILEIVLN
jgi:aspartate carbamoyltransferase regulatory subunit